MNSSSGKRSSQNHLPNGSNHALDKSFKSSRLSLGTRAGDIVAVMNHSEILDESSALFCEHVNRADNKIFTIKNAGTPDVKHVGREENAGDGFEYVLALVDRRTRRAVEYRPVSVVQFEAVYKPAPELLTGERPQVRRDYSQNFSVEGDDVAAKRRRLTEVFGSQKKNKVLEANMRRKVTEETLTAMTSTAFASPNIGGDILERKFKEDGTPNIPLIQQAESSVLPLPNLEAKRPSEVYKLDQFITGSAYEMAGGSSELEQEALQFFTLCKPQELIKKNIAKIVANRIGDVHAFPDPGKRAVQALKMVVLSRIIEAVIAPSKNNSSISLDQIEALKLPPRMLTEVRGEYFGESRKIKNQMRLQVNATQKNKIIAHFLCMMLLFDEPDFTLPISSLNVELNIGEMTSVKLLQALGCTITQCTPEQAILHNSLRIARLTGPPVKPGRRRHGRK